MLDKGQIVVITVAGPHKGRLAEVICLDALDTTEEETWYQFRVEGETGTLVGREDMIEEL